MQNQIFEMVTYINLNKPVPVGANVALVGGGRARVTRSGHGLLYLEYHGVECWARRRDILGTV